MSHQFLRHLEIGARCQPPLISLLISPFKLKILHRLNPNPSRKWMLKHLGLTESEMINTFAVGVTMSLRLLSPVLLLLYLVTHVYAQDCGPNPELNISYSDNFKKSVIKLSQAAGDTSATAASEYFFLTGDHTYSQSDLDSISIEQAQQFIQTEIKNQYAAILATCGYYSCLISRSPESVAIASEERYSNVCSLAFGDGPNRYSQVLAAMPSYQAVSFGSAQTLDLVGEIGNNNSSGTVTVKVIPQGMVDLISPSTPQFDISPNGSQALKFRVSKPPADIGAIPASIKFELVTDYKNAVEFRFKLAADPTDFLPPMSLPCGTFDPHGAFTADDNTGPDGHRHSAGDTGAPPPLVPGQPYIFNIGDGYPSNGGGSGWVKGKANCTQILSSKTEARTELQWNFAIGASNGDCCDGWGSGGYAEAIPAWNAVVSFIGRLSIDKWHLDVTDAALAAAISSLPADKRQSHSFAVSTSRALQQPCVLSVDGKAGTSWDDLNSGDHKLEYTCGKDSVGVHQPTVDNQSKNDMVNLFLYAKRQAPPPSPQPPPTPKGGGTTALLVLAGLVAVSKWASRSVGMRPWLIKDLLKRSRGFSSLYLERDAVRVAAQYLLAILSVALCYCFAWTWLRSLTLMANTWLDRLIGLPVVRLSSTEILFRGETYTYGVACTMIDVICGAIPLLWCSRRSIRSNIQLISAMAIAITTFNVARLTMSDYLVWAGVSWPIGHNAVSGVCYFVIWLVLQEIRSHHDGSRISTLCDSVETSSSMVRLRYSPPV